MVAVPHAQALAQRSKKGRVEKGQDNMPSPTYLHVWHPVLTLGALARFLWPGLTRVMVYWESGRRQVTRRKRQRMSRQKGQADSWQSGPYDRTNNGRPGDAADQMHLSRPAAFFNIDLPARLMIYEPMAAYTMKRITFAVAPPTRRYFSGTRPMPMSASR